MAIAPNSRYAQSTIITLDQPGGNSRQAIYPRNFGGFTFSYISHHYSTAETPDGLAHAYYGDPTQWWKIGQANPEIMDWSDVAPGTVLRIPAG